MRVYYNTPKRSIILQRIKYLLRVYDMISVVCLLINSYSFKLQNKINPIRDINHVWHLILQVWRTCPKCCFVLIIRF